MTRNFKMTKMDTMLYQMILHSKGQFIAVLTIIIVGIAVYIALGATAINMDNTVNAYYDENNFADIFIDAETVPSGKVSQLTDIDGILVAQGRITIEGPLITENPNERINLRLVTIQEDAENGERLNESTLISGRMPSVGSKETAVVLQFAEARNIKTGDEMKVQAEGGQYTLEVVGIVANPEYIYLIESAQTMMPNPEKFGICYISESLGQQMWGTKGAYNNILVDYEEKADSEKMIEEIEDSLSTYSVQQVLDREDQLSNTMIQEELEQLAVMSDSLPILFLIVAALILVMILSRMIKKDRIKIGVLKALGYSNREVILHYIKYALIAGIIGGFVGSIGGMLLSGAMTRLYLEFFCIPLLKVGFYPIYVIISVIFSAIFCMVAGIIGARGVLKISPADSMHNEAPKVGKRILLEKILFIWKKLSFSHKLIFKNIFRNKKRALFVLAGVAVTYALMLFTTCMPGAMDDIMNKHFQEFQTMDYNIDFRRPIKESAGEDLRYIIDVDYMEGKMEYPFELSHGNKKKTASIIGLQKDTKFYSFLDLEGNPVEIPEDGLLITENLANSLAAKVGDELAVKSVISGKEDVYLQVKAVVKQSLGMNAYMNQESMGEILFEKNAITGLYIDSTQENINEKLIYASNIASIMSTEEMRNTFNTYMSMVWASISMMIVFGGILGFCIVFNATIISIGEREMEFSTLRVLGLGQNEIFRMILYENTYISIIGMLVGVPLGKLMILYSMRAFQSDLYSIVIQPNPFAYLTAIIFTAICIFFAQIATYRKITKLEFLQALKNRTT